MKKIWREDVIAIIFLAPIVIMVLFRLIISFLLPYLATLLDFNIAEYEKYILSLVLFISPSMLGMVMGFMLIHDKDNKIVELMSVTPMGKQGYLIIRLSFVFLFTFIYTLYGYLVIGLYLIPIGTLLYITVLLSIYSTIFSLLLFRVATDKVKGLTYAKGLNVLMIFAFARLFDTPWITILSAFFPSYWITEIIIKPNDFLILSLGLVVHVVWFGICLLSVRFKKS